MTTFRIHYTINGRNGYTDMQGNDPEVLREKFRKLYPGAILGKVKVVRS